MEHEGEPGERLVAEGGERPLVLDLRLGDRRRRTDARLAGARLGLGDALRPGLGQLQEPHGVAGRRGVEDHEVEAGAARGRQRGRRRVEEVGEAVERGDLGGARTGELLLHDPHDLRGEDLADRRQRPVGVLRGRPVGVDLHRPQVGHAGDRGDCVADRLLEHVGQVRGRVGGHDEDASARIGFGDGGGAGHRGLADAALAGEEEELGHRVILSRAGAGGSGAGRARP